MPGPVAAGQVGRPAQSEVLERGGGEARRVSLGADDDHPQVMVAGFWDARLGGGVETPLEHVAPQDPGAGKAAFAATLLARADVDQERSRLLLLRSLKSVDPLQP